jgi:Zn-dependent protease
MGLLIMFISMYLFNVGIGWAKPVPINPYNFKDMKKGTLYTAAAGPFSNFVMAIVFALLFKLLIMGYYTPGEITLYSQILLIILLVLRYFVFYNVLLGLFNLIPFPPLDGSKILGGFLSDDLYFKWMSLERKGFFVLLALMIIGQLFGVSIIGLIIFKPTEYIVSLLLGINL